MFFYENQWFGGDYMYNSFALENCNFPDHFHRTFEFIFVSEGTLSMTINGQNYYLHKNEMAFIFPNQLHSFDTKEHSRIVLLIFPHEMIESFYKKYQNMVPESNVISYKTAPYEKFEFKNIYDCKSFLYQMCGQLIQQTEFISYSSGIDRKSLLYKLLNYVQEHYEETCTLAQATKQLGYDYTYLSKFFQEKMSMPFTSYLNQYRISQACFLLHNTKESISAIAMKCGYDTIRTFNRNFKSFTGVSPSEYKRTSTRHIF